MTPMQEQRGQWQTQSGFLLAALGAAIGLGNLWRFSYVVGENGGGAFLVVYFATIAVIGLPLLLAELAIGRDTQRESASAFETAGRSEPWRRAGIPGVFISFVILTYYGVIAGWTLKYLVAFAFGLYPDRPDASAAYFDTFVSSTLEPLFWQIAIMAVSTAIVLGGVERGIERVSKMLMPVLAIIVVALAIHSLTLPNARDGLAFLFSPKWEALTEPRVYLAAMGQAFFSLGLAMGVLVTYGSYLKRDSKLPASAIVVTVGDTLFAIAAAIVIFPAVFSFGMNPGQGPGLAFVMLPEIFVRMNAGFLVGALFFGLLVMAAITSVIALLEIPVAYAIDKWEYTRSRAALMIGGAATALGIPSSLGFGVLADVRLFGMQILDAVDFVASNIILPLSGLAIVLFVGWHWRKAAAIRAAGFKHPALAAWWHFSLRYLAPVLIAIIFLRSISLI